MAQDPDTSHNPTILVTAVRYTPYTEEIYEKGFRVITSLVRRNSQSPLPGMKTTCFLESLLARQEARAAGADDALLLNDRGYLAEASSSNVFIVANNTLKTPGLENGILPGITRKVVLELASELGIKIVEFDIRPEELTNADEAFITNSMTEIMPVTSIDGKIISSGNPGPVTQKLVNIYKYKVIKETE